MTFCTKNSRVLPESVRSIVLAHCLHDHGRTVHVHGVVVMPDHVHMVLTPLMNDRGEPFRLTQILSAIKGASAHSINRMLRRKGVVWQDESFDHILSTEESAESKVQYICQNPVRRGITKAEDDYPWLWRDWIEGKTSAAGGRPTL